MTKTPQFDAEIGKILENLSPSMRVCKSCGTQFQIYEEDIRFYRSLLIPPPTLCPLCRKKRRMAHLMRVPKFFKKECNAEGHSESLVSVYPKESPHKVYDTPYWFSDEWDAEDYCREYDIEKDFFSQFKELFFDVPRIPIDRDLTATNCDYSVGGKHGKNLYYCGGGYRSEDCMYDMNTRFSKSCIDSTNVWHSELCSNCVDAEKCSNCIYVHNSSNCLDSAFLYDSRNCSHCFMSSNLRNKSYVFQNQQLSREEYKKRIESVNTGNREELEVYISKFNDLLTRAVRRAVTNTNTANSAGDKLTNCKDCFFAFDGTNGENLRYTNGFDSLRDVMDVSFSAENTEKCYECIIALGSGMKSCMFVRSSMDLEYCSDCHNSKYCFGCVGLRNKEYCIFNKKYSEDEYWKKVDEIKTRMLQDGTYGEFFDVSLNLIPYQSSNAEYYWPLSEKERKEKGVMWYEESGINIPEGMETLVPGKDKEFLDIKNVGDDILQKAIICKKTKKPFRVIESELQLLRKLNIPLPTKHPWERIMERKVYEHDIDLYPFTCPSCRKNTHSVYNETKQKEYKIFCEECYNKEVV